MTKKATTCGRISPRLWQRQQDRGDDCDREQFWEGVKGYGGGNSEVVLNNSGNPRPPTLP